MGKFIFLCILATGGYFAYPKYIKPYFSPSEAAVAYNQFAQALTFSRFSEAKSLAQGQALSTVEEEERLQTGNISQINPFASSTGFANEARKEAGQGPLADKSTVTRTQLIDQMAGRITGAKFDVTSEQESENSSMLEVKGSVCREQPGCSGMRCTHCAKSLHTVEMCKSTDGWLVCSYEIEDVEQQK